MYVPGEKLTFSMPKKLFSYRPVTYLNPIDSIIYQALVDQLISYKREKFSCHVYSNIINKIQSSNVFDNPVKNWIKMKNNIRETHKKNNPYYYFSDVSGYFENIKIDKLFDILKFYTGRNEKKYIPCLEILLKKWSYATAQGLVQPHHASSILSKIYLTPVDSKLGYLGKKYNRYVDEFHVLAQEKHELLKITMELSEGLRELGLNINVSKSKLLEGNDVDIELDEDKDFFNQVGYLYKIHEYDRAYDLVTAEFHRFVETFTLNKSNIKLFRYCIRRFKKNKDPIAVDFCIQNYEKLGATTVDIVLYLNLFVNDKEYARTIQDFIFAYLKDYTKNLYAWNQIWFLALLCSVNSVSYLDIEYIWQLCRTNDLDELSRSICILILGKNLNDNDLICLRELYDSSSSLLLKRCILLALSKMPSTYMEELLMESEYDDLHLQVMKKYIRFSGFNIADYVILK